MEFGGKRLEESSDTRGDREAAPLGPYALCRSAAPAIGRSSLTLSSWGGRTLRPPPPVPRVVRNLCPGVLGHPLSCDGPEAPATVPRKIL